MKSSFLLPAAVILAASPTLAPADPAPEPIANVAAVMPRHGTVSVKPADGWENALATGNGTMGAMLFGGPGHEEILVDHAKAWLPKGSREVLPTEGDLADMRRAIREKGYGEGQRVFLDNARRQGWGGSLVWTDPYHPAFSLELDQPVSGPVTDYARVEDFSTGEVWTQWKTGDGDFSRRLFVSRTDNTVVATLLGPPGQVSCKLDLRKIDSDLIHSSVDYSEGWILCHNVYVKGKGGYDGAVRVSIDGGTQTSDGKSITVSHANAVTLYLRVLPWRTPLPDSQSWVTSPDNPDFADGPHPARRDTVQAAAKQYDPRWLQAMQADLQSLGSYGALFQAHAAWWGGMFNRVSLDLGGAPEERALSSEAILDKAQRDQRLSPALLERMYDAGRYVFLCCAGPQTPPNLFGIWTGTWSPAWSGDYTTDTNLELDCEEAYSANLAECMNGYFFLWDSFLPDFRRNTQALYGCRGILAGSRQSNNGLALHWDGGWPGNQWTPGAAWIAHWYYDYYAYTGDKEFLRKEAIPFMKECALFYEDFLRGTEDASGHYTFSPSFSAENGSGDNASQDIEISHELLTHLIAGCETLGIEPEGVARWKALLAKMPPLLVNEQGQLQEWSNPTSHEHNDHRHIMHLYGAFESFQFSEEADPRLFAAARVALVNRTTANRSDATHGHMHMSLAAAELGLGDLSFERLELLAKHRSIFPNMVDGHFGGPDVLCDDGNGATPEIVDRMVIQSDLGRLALLPALPAALPRGTLCGTRARGNILVDRLQWDWPAGKVSAVLTAEVDQSVALVLPPGVIVDALTVDGAAVLPVEEGVKKQGCQLHLPAGKSVAVEASFHPSPR